MTNKQPNLSEQLMLLIGDLESKKVKDADIQAANNKLKSASKSLGISIKVKKDKRKKK